MDELTQINVFYTGYNYIIYVNVELVFTLNVNV